MDSLKKPGGEGTGTGRQENRFHPSRLPEGKQPCRQVDFSRDSGRSSNLQNFKIINVVFKPLNPWQFVMPANETNKQKKTIQITSTHLLPIFLIYSYYCGVKLDRNEFSHMHAWQQKEGNEGKEEVVISKMVIHIYSF